MLSRLRRGRGDPPTLTNVNYTAEHVTLARSIQRRQELLRRIWDAIPTVRLIMVIVGYAWILALPYEGLWKGTYIDEHALQPGQVTMYFDWPNVHEADRYLDHLEQMVNATLTERSSYLLTSLRESGLTAGDTSQAVYAHITPPRSAGTETILLSANWVSRDGVPNLRGIATLLAMGDFLRGQNHWAFDFVLVFGDGYLSGLSSFMESYHDLFPGVIWTALNIDYPGHSFSHLGVFYEGINGRLPNQDIPNTIAHVGKWAGGLEMRLHDVDDTVPDLPGWVTGALGTYIVGARHLWEHYRYAALGKASGAHGVLAKYRIDSSTMYCTPATGPHGFHALGRTLESTLRSLNNLLERLHASYFFYLLPRPGKFIPVGHYLPAAILLGASVTIGGFHCPDPLAGLAYLLLAFAIGGIGWLTQTPLVSLAALILPRPQSTTRDSLVSLTHLLYGALIPTLAMVNFPQSILLATITIAYLVPYRLLRLAVLALHPALLRGLEKEWAFGNVMWPGVFAVWIPLWVVAAVL